MPRKPKAEPSQHGGYRHGIPAATQVRINLKVPADDRDLLNAAALAAGYTRESGGMKAWAMAILLREARAELDKKR
jgi:uncharacterized protein (DUF1778 family)